MPAAVGELPDSTITPPDALLFDAPVPMMMSPLVPVPLGRPVCKYALPELPFTDTPVPRYRGPDAVDPRAPPVLSSARPLPAVTLVLSAVDMDSMPEAASRDEPVRSSTDPPSEAVPLDIPPVTVTSPPALVEELPAFRERRAPTPTALLPAPTETLPAVLLLEAPLDITTGPLDPRVLLPLSRLRLPERPTLVVPEASTTLPLTPEAVLPECTVTPPLWPRADPPDAISNAPLLALEPDTVAEATTMEPELEAFPEPL